MDCQGCGLEGVDRMSDEWTRANDDTSIGRYVITHDNGESEQVRYCYGCRDTVMVAIKVSGSFESIVDIESA